jgi:hypothetical protein
MYTHAFIHISSDSIVQSDRLQNKPDDEDNSMIWIVEIDGLVLC